MELLSDAQRDMERITLREHKRNTWIRHHGVNDIIDVIKTDRQTDRQDRQTYRTVI